MADTIKTRLEYLRGELRAERISTGELIELQSLAQHIEPGDVELLEAAGVPEFPESDESETSSASHYVCGDGEEKFASLDAANAHAKHVFESSGVVVGIVERVTRYAVTRENPEGGVGAVDWYFDREAADKAFDAAVADDPADEVNLFAFDVDATATADEVTDEADDLMWSGDYEPLRRSRPLPEPGDWDALRKAAAAAHDLLSDPSRLSDAAAIGEVLAALRHALDDVPDDGGAIAARVNAGIDKGENPVRLVASVRASGVSLSFDRNTTAEDVRDALLAGFAAQVVTDFANVEFLSFENEDDDIDGDES